MAIPPNLIPYVNPRTGTLSLEATDEIDEVFTRNAKVEAIIRDNTRSQEDRIDAVNTYMNGQGGNIDQRDLLRRIKEATPQTMTAQDAEVPSAPPVVEETVVPVQGEEIVATAQGERADHRVRLSAFWGREKDVYGVNDKTANILTPLYATGGLVFPYTPTVNVSQDTSWQTADLEQTNYDILSFQKASSATFSLTGKFTVQNQREGEYLLAALHFLRTVSKAYFGAQDVEQFVAPETNTETEEQVDRTRKDGKAGLPPPVLLFSGYGNMMFNDVRVVVKSHSWSFEENQDLIRIKLPTGGEVWLPPLMSVSMSLAMQMNTDRLREEFKLDDFREGRLLNGKSAINKGWF